jgi:hypothetical protein
MTLEMSFMLLESSIMLLENNYSRGITNGKLSYFYNTGNRYTLLNISHTDPYMQQTAKEPHALVKRIEDSLLNRLKLY